MGPVATRVRQYGQDPEACYALVVGGASTAKTTNAIPRRLPLPPHPLSREVKPAEGFPNLYLSATRQNIMGYVVTLLELAWQIHQEIETRTKESIDRQTLRTRTLKAIWTSSELRLRLRACQSANSVSHATLQVFIGLYLAPATGRVDRKT